MSAPGKTSGGQAVLLFMAHVLRRFPLARWAVLLTFVLLVLEYVGISLMIPLASANNPDAHPSKVAELWNEVVRAVGLPPTIMTWVWLFLLLLTLRSAAGYLHVLLTTFVAKQVHRQLSEDVFRRVLIDEPMASVYKRSIGHYVSLAGDDTFRAGSLIHSGLLMLAGACSAGAGLVLLYLFSPLMFWATMGFLGVSAVLVGLCLKQMLRLNRRSVDLSREAGTGFLEALNSLRSIRSMDCEPFVHATYRDQMRRYTRLLFEIDAFKAGIRAVPGLVALLTGVIGLAPWWAGQVPLASETVFAGTTIIIRVFVSLGALMTAGGTFLVDARAAKDLRELIEGPGQTPRASGPGAPLAAPFDELALVGLRYGYLADMPVLRDLSFDFRRGCTHAIIGPSGSGKSTLADVLLGMVEPDEGRILLDKRAVAAADLRQRVVLVEQQPRIFSASVRDNLCLGLTLDDHALNEALQTVDMLEVVQGLPAGLDTPLDYQGSNLSGGQRQRLSIARALLRQPQILILDEATSALDPTTRDTVVARIKQRLHDGVLVFITHDETIAALADTVLALSPSGAETPAAKSTAEAAHD
ncbi:ABC transporter ATP-binding protein [Ideonella margarita]|uniref:ABC transporter ATP-binding protein n=1 Tax=Ideonella margarita TaxID=2984191 RepID=A0ABU9BZL3_9BURK